MIKKIPSIVLLIFLILLIIISFSINYKMTFVDELIYCRWIYKMISENLNILLPIQWGKHPVFFWFNRLIITFLKAFPYSNLSILNILKGTAIFNLLMTSFGMSLFFKEKKLKVIIPILFLFGPFFLIYFSIGTVENIIVPLVIIYWYCLDKLINNIDNKKIWLKLYILANVLGLLVALTKSNSSSVILSSLIYFIVIVKINRVKINLKWLCLIFLHIIFLIINLLIAFYFSKAESNNVMSFKINIYSLLISFFKYFSYIPYFFSFTFIYLIIISFLKISLRSSVNYLNKSVSKLLFVNLLIGLVIVSLLKVYYPRYYLVAILPLFMLLAQIFEKTCKIFLKEKNLFIGLILCIFVDLLFVLFPYTVYKWRIPRIDIVQHFERSSVQIPYDFKKNVLDRNSNVIFLINDERYGANNLFYGLIPISIRRQNFRIDVYADIDNLNCINLCKRYSKSLIYILGNSSITKNKQALKNILLKSYYSSNKKEYISIYKLLCK